MMKRVFVLISLVVAILVIGGNAFAQDNIFEAPPSILDPHKASIPAPSLSSKWILLGRYSDGTTAYFNIRRITHLPKGIVKVWTLYVPRGEWRKEQVNALKKDLLSEGKDPNNAERLWYFKSLMKINCRAHQFVPLEHIAYSFGKRILGDSSPQYEEWYDITPGGSTEEVEKYVCNKSSIPEPSLSSKWKLVFSNSGLSTVYVDTRRITHLPKGIVKVWILTVPRGEFRRGLVHFLKKIFLSEGKDPNNAKRLWFEIQLNKLNCKNHKYAISNFIDYSLEGVALYSHSSQHEKWKDIPPRTAGEDIEKFVCKKYK